MMFAQQFMHSRTARVLGTAVLLTALSACGESATEPGGEQEVISRVTLTLTQSGTSTTVTSYIDDPDGNGSQSPSAQVGPLRLVPGATYTGTVKFENRLVSPPEDITKEVQEEANEHRVFYTVTGSGLTVTTTDLDSQGRPLGLRFNAVTASTGSGSLRVVLCHYDDSPKNASATSCTGDTDIDLSFTYSIGN
jgi:hypothetical protein